MRGRILKNGWTALLLLGTSLTGGCGLLDRSTSRNTPVPAADAVPSAAEQEVQQQSAPASSDKSAQAAPAPDGPVITAGYNGTATNEPPRIAPQAVAQTPAPMPAGQPNPHERQSPTAAGALLNLAPGESPVERLAKATLELTAAEADRKKLEGRVQQMTGELETREKVIQQSVREMQQATEEVQRTRTVTAGLRKELDDLRGVLMRREKDEADTLKAINKLLERLADEKTRAEGESRAPVQNR